MPELPEVEITARLLDRALAGTLVAYARAPGINALKSFDPPLSALEGRRITAVRRRGKQLIVEIDRDGDGRDQASRGPLALLIHLMSAGRLQLYDKPAGPRDRTSRLVVGVEDGRELRLREFGSKQAAWVKLVRADELAQEHSLATLGPEAWPSPGDPAGLKALLDAPRPLHTLLRDQHAIAGIGRSWVDEILWQAELSPYKRGSDLDEDEARRLRAAIVATLGGAIDHYEQAVELPIPDKLPLPLQIHRHQREPCPRCGATLEAVHFEDYVIAYCPACQTDGKVLKDRRLSRLLR
ncbi:MAG TPA: DNA-formamidopyrimidine glycosylase family protein [Solirubrobacteraceae bacterium]|jgi:formamidopyrimidine-DNA glycosylase|nr:DNA-formamidopyrimidine glycosylase family protein [Solirubrobacteraceae bacterium]